MTTTLKALGGRLRGQIRLIWLIGLNTFKETIRDRILYLIVVFSIIVIAATLLAASVSLGQDVRVIKSFGLQAMLFLLLVITVFSGTQLIWREIERQTIYFILTKPVSREIWLLGKYLGLALTVTLVGLIMGTEFLILLKVKGVLELIPTIATICFILLESYLVIAISLFFSSFAAPLSSAIYTFLVVLVGHSSSTLWLISQKASPAIKYLLETIYYLFPNLEKFNLRNELIYGLTVDRAQLLAVLGYFVGYSLVLLLLALAAARRGEY
ncbi:MAG: ABC transporter permease subunit [Patescibacteria group bacterium]